MNEADVCVIGGGVVGASVALALAQRDLEVTLLEAEGELCLGASGSNSGILHTGFDSTPGTLETRLILRSAALRRQTLDALQIPLVATGALVRPRDGGERAAIAKLADRARENGVASELGPDGSLRVPGEAVTDPLAFTLGIAAAAAGEGADVCCRAPVSEIRLDRRRLVLSYGEGREIGCRAAVNCAGLFADDVARAAGDNHFRIVPRKGEFFVFEPPDGPLEQIVLPVPSARGKGVLVFPTVDGKMVAGPTALDQDDKRDRSVRPEALSEVMTDATRLVPELEGREPIASYAGLRPAGDGVNYLIEHSRVCPGLVHVAAIRSTGLSASLGIAEHVAELVRELGVEMGSPRPLRAGDPEALPGSAREHATDPSVPWWGRASEEGARVR